MLASLAASGLGLLALPGLLRPVGRRLRPAEWARTSLLCIGAGAAVVELAAVLYGLPAVATASGVPSLEVLCHRALGPLAPGGPVVGWTAIAVAVGLPAVGGLGWSRARRTARSARIEPGLGHHEPYGGHELVVLPTERPLAVSVPVPSGQSGRHQIVVSDGLVDLLTPAQLDAVLRHEAAHLRHGHRRHLAVAAAVDGAFAWFPPRRGQHGDLAGRAGAHGRRARRRHRRPRHRARRPPRRDHEDAVGPGSGGLLRRGDDR